MTKFNATGCTVRPTADGRIELVLWSDEAESTLTMSNDECLQKVADFINAIAANRGGDAVKS